MITSALSSAAPVESTMVPVSSADNAVHASNRKGTTKVAQRILRLYGSMMNEKYPCMSSPSSDPISEAAVRLSEDTDLVQHVGVVGL